MSDYTIQPFNSNVKVMPNMAERQSFKTGHVFNPSNNLGTPTIPSFIDPTKDIIQQLNLPPLTPTPTQQPPMAFSPGQSLSASAPSFSPNAPSSIPFPNCENAPKEINSHSISDSQILSVQTSLQHSSSKLQLFSSQLSLLNQQLQTPLSLQQYQSIYQQYQLEMANTVLLTQYLKNLQNAQYLQQYLPQPTNTNTNTTNNTTITTPGGLETIKEEGEEDQTQPIASSIPAAASHSGEGTTSDDMKSYPLETETETETETNIGEKSLPLAKAAKKKKKRSELDKIKKQIRGILNKINSENFDKLSQDIAGILKVADIAAKDLHFSLRPDELAMAQKAQFKALIRLVLKCILEKAVNEPPLFSNQYARLCYSLYLYGEDNESKKKVFRLQLITLCHSVFKKSRQNGESKRFIGIVAMIGELFAYGLVSWNVVSSGIFEELLPPEQALDVEAVCKLLKTSGHLFDKHYFKEINAVIHRLKKYGANFGFRAQCLVEEIYEMRKNEWKTRKDLEEQKQRQSQSQSQIQIQQQQPPKPKAKPKYSNSNSKYNRQWRGNNNARSNQRYNNNHNQRYNKYSKHSNRRKGKQIKPTVEFVKDVTLPDRTHYKQNVVLTKTWAMRNSGDRNWGEGVELVYFKGDEQLSVRKRYPVKNAVSGEEVEISAEIRTPREQGRYCTYFRLMRNGKFFGPRVWVDIIVD